MNQRNNSLLISMLALATGSEKCHHLSRDGSANTLGNSDENSSFAQSEKSMSIDDHDTQTLFESFCEDEKLLSHLLGEEEPPLIDTSAWELPNNGPLFNHCANSFTKWDDCATWLLDCQDFGVHDFGLDSFNDVEINILNTKNN
ncbi:hypothetical protein Ccrd_006050 [Cynara cardunculus var. scolymus]|uniref:Uncharacterized protein n=1 Tax=Cynara cardunculus var. scolymus TaxID=59895 RepID=A0A103XJJ9_CYNCS|nr:hypothetical protein Ccrd_006050 [Cynara cardunculus var. scolymus]